MQKSKFSPFRWRHFAKKILKLYTYNEMGSTLFVEAIDTRGGFEHGKRKYYTTDLGLIFIDQYILNLDEQIAKTLRLRTNAIDKSEQTIRLALRNTLDIFYGKSVEEIYDIPTEEILMEISEEHEVAKEAAWVVIEERVEDEFDLERFIGLLHSEGAFRNLKRNVNIIINEHKTEGGLHHESNIGVEHTGYVANIPDLRIMPDYQFIIALSDVLDREVNWREFNLKKALGFYKGSHIPEEVVEQAMQNAHVKTFDTLEGIFEDLLKELWEEKPVDERYLEEQELEEYRIEHWNYLKSVECIDDDE